MVTFTVNGLAPGGSVAINYHWHLTGHAGGGSQTVNVGPGGGSFQISVTSPQPQQSFADAVVVDWSAAGGLGGSTNAVPVSVTCKGGPSR